MRCRSYFMTKSYNSDIILRRMDDMVVPSFGRRYYATADGKIMKRRVFGHRLIGRIFQQEEQVQITYLEQYKKSAEKCARLYERRLNKSATAIPANPELLGIENEEASVLGSFTG